LGIIYNHKWTVIACADRATRLDAMFGSCPVRILVEISGVLTVVCRGFPLYHMSRLIPGHNLSQVTPAYFRRLPTSLFSSLYHSPSYDSAVKCSKVTFSEMFTDYEYLHLKMHSYKQNRTASVGRVAFHTLYVDTLNVKYEGWNFNSGNYLFTTDTK